MLFIFLLAYLVFTYIISDFLNVSFSCIIIAIHWRWLLRIEKILSLPQD